MSPVNRASLVSKILPHSVTAILLFKTSFIPVIEAMFTRDRFQMVSIQKSCRIGLLFTRDLLTVPSIRSRSGPKTGPPKKQVQFLEPFRSQTDPSPCEHPDRFLLADPSPSIQIQYQELQMKMAKLYTDDVFMFGPVVASKLVDDFNKTFKGQGSQSEESCLFHLNHRGEISYNL